MTLTAAQLAVLNLIRNGAYGTELPDDDATAEALGDCEYMGLIAWESARMDDFYHLTEAGFKALAVPNGEGKTHG